jgi:hypothetical protein
MAVLNADPLLGRWAIIPSVNVIEPPADTIECSPEPYREVGSRSLEIQLSQRPAARCPITRGEDEVIKFSQLRESSGDCGFVRNIYSHAGRLARKSGPSGFNVGRVAGSNNDIRTLAKRGLGNRETNAGCSANDDYTLILQAHGLSDRYPLLAVEFCQQLTRTQASAKGMGGKKSCEEGNRLNLPFSTHAPSKATLARGVAD